LWVQTPVCFSLPSGCWARSPGTGYWRSSLFKTNLTIEETYTIYKISFKNFVCINLKLLINFRVLIHNRKLHIRDTLFYVGELFVCLNCFWRNSLQWARSSSFTRFLDHT
jgi:hypothetical protein